MIRRYGSLCTGYDGIGLGLALAGVATDPLFFAENEASVAEVLKLEHPNVPNVKDIKTAPWHLAPHVELMSSGDPCQSISIAGRQQGRKDPRFLWPWVREAYRAVRPDVIFFENVAGIVSHDDGRTLAERFEHLREDGYSVRWTVIGACAVGAPHHRHRWYALAWRDGAASGTMRVGGKTATCGAPRGKARQLLPTPQGRDGKGASARGPHPDGRLERTPNDGCLPKAVSLLPTPNARDGGARGTPSPEHAARRLADPMRSLNLEDAAVLLPTPMAARSGNNRGEAEGSACQPEVWGRYAEAVALWEQITGVLAPEPTEIGPKGGRRLNPALSEWMMGLRPGLLTGRMSRNDALRATGNGVVPHQCAAAWKVLTAT